MQFPALVRMCCIPRPGTLHNLNAHAQNEDPARPAEPWAKAYDIYQAGSPTLTQPRPSD
jgi:hypothetical protein